MKLHICLLLFLYVAAGFFWNASASTPQEIESLINQLNDESGEVVNNASQNLIRIGKPAVAQLLKALPTAARPLRYRIVDIFTSMKSDAEETVPALVAELRGPNIEGLSYATYHYKVAVALASIGPSAVAGLTETLSDPTHSARQYAKFALSYMGSEARTSVPASTPQEIESLVNQLNDESGQVIHNASGTLIQIGKAAVPQLLKALPTAAGPLRYEIVDIFASMTSDAEAAVPALIAELRGPNIAGRSYANYHYTVAMALASIGPSALEKLTEGLYDPHHNARRYTAYALGWLGMEARESVPALMPLLRDEHDEVRAAAAGALGGIADPIAVPALIAALDDKNDDVRTGAAIALGEIGAPAEAAVPVLIHRSKVVKIVMNRELKSIIRGLGGIGTPDVVPVLTEALKDSSALIRLTAVRALGDTGDPIAVPALIAALGDKNDDVRTGAAIALGEIGAPAKAAVPVLIDMLEQAGCIERSCIIQGLGGIGTPDVIPVLKDALNDESSQIRYTAEIELRKLIGDK